MRKKLLCLLVAFAAVLATVPVASPSQAAPPTGQDYFRLVSLATTQARCVVDRHEVSFAQTFTCGTWDDQYFRWIHKFTVDGQPYYNIYNYANQTCLGVENNVTNAPVTATFLCDLYSHIWTMVWNSAGGFYQLRNYGTGRCMVARPDTTGVVQYNCGNWRDQGFTWYYW